MNGATNYQLNVGSLSGNDPYIINGSYDTGSSTNDFVGGFGYSNEFLLWAGSLGTDPGTVVVDRTFFQPGETVASAFGTNLASGPVVLWTHTNSGDTISIQAIPEPSSSLLLVAGIAGLAFRRNRN